MSGQYSNNQSYTAIGAVQFTHQILHLSPSLHEVSNTFNITYDNYYNEYTRSLLPIPILCGALGILALFIFQFALCARLCCCTWCRCVPELSRNRNEELDELIVKPCRNWLKWVFVVTAVLTILTDQTLIAGKIRLTTGVSKARDSIDYLSNVFNLLNDDASLLYDYGDELTFDFSSSYDNGNGCQYSDDLLAGISTYDEYVDEFDDFVSPVPSQLTSASNDVQRWGIKYPNYFLWALYGLILIFVSLFLLSYFACGSRNSMRGSVFLSCLLLLFPLFLLIAGEMGILMGLSDFCMQPTEYIIPLVPPDIRNLTSYYTTCAGVNPISPVIQEAITYTTQYQGYVSDALTQCPGDTYLLDAQSVLVNVQSVLTNVTSTIVCPPTQNQLLNLLQDNLCDTSFQGLYLSWLGIYVTSGLLLLLVIVSSLLYQFLDLQALRRNRLSSSFDDGLQHFDSYFLADEEGRGSLTAVNSNIGVASPLSPYQTSASSLSPLPSSRSPVIVNQPSQQRRQQPATAGVSGVSPAVVYSADGVEVQPRKGNLNFGYKGSVSSYIINNNNNSNYDHDYDYDEYGDDEKAGSSSGGNTKKKG